MGLLVGKDGPRGPCRAPASAPIIEAVDEELEILTGEIQALIDAPVEGERAPSLALLEDTLTTGYARALALEAERARLERRIGSELEAGATAELSQLARVRARVDAQSVSLRALLSRLRIRASELRAA